MSYGPLAGLHFESNNRAGAPGIFWQKEKPKNEPKKFGYKSKKLRHPIRRPDEEAALKALEEAKEEEKKKFNKGNKNFILNNRERFKPRSESQAPPPKGSEIKPGTVTLTQEQLAALLASLGKTQTKGDDSSMKISIDPSSNRIQVEQYDSDDSGHAAHQRTNNRHTNEDDDDDDVGIGAFLNGGDTSSKQDKPKGPDRRDAREGPSHRLQPPSSRQAETRVSLEEAKKEAGVAHVADSVPWKHLTVGERKRMQWARERAELAENYDPWGRPGAGAPPNQKPEPEPPQQQKPPQQRPSPPQQQQQHRPAPPSQGRDTVSRNRTESVDPIKRKQQEILENEIEKLRKEIQEAEDRKKKREEAKENDGGIQAERGRQEVEEKRKERKTEKKTERKRAERREEPPQQESSKEENQEAEDSSQLSKKEQERRKWLAELDKQREEQRMRKQQEKERDRAGIHDQWADRFVYHKSIEQSTPRGQLPKPREEMSVLGKVTETEAPTGYAPPVAMRSALVVGAGTLNESRYDNKKAEEKRRWLEELEKQREEQRMAKAAQKEQERQEDGTWADRYPTDHKKLLQTNDILEKHGPSPRDPVPTVSLSEAQRTSSAPGAAQATLDAEEGPTFLRGQGVFVDPATRKEQEEKRRVYLEYQAQVKAQIEEKERQKQAERDRKRREDIEEERRLQMEREAQKNQLDQEQRKFREREEQRQRQIDTLKNAMDEAQEKAQEDKHLRRLQKLKEQGHDVAHLKATYDASSPRRKAYDLSAIPGLGLDASEDYQLPPSPPPPVMETAAARMDARPAASRHVIGQSYTKESHAAKEPYTEDRVLTPSRFRNLSKPVDNPNSPRREFGTQTLELKDLQDILKSLPDEVQIEYKLKVEEALKGKERERQRERQTGPVRRTQAKSADETERKARAKKPDDNPRLPRKKVVETEEPPDPKKPGNLGARPKWNQNQKRAVKKNSEKDPFYQQRKEEKEQRKAKRERQLQYLQELNQDRIPAVSKSPARSRDVSPEGKKPAGERGRKPGPRGQPQAQQRDESPNILSLLNETDRGHRSKSPMQTGRNSPPIPAVRHRADRGIDTNRDPYQYANNYLRHSQTDSKYGDVAISPISDSDFLPFMRTTEILDPSKADEPVAISRENSRMEKARRAYHETLNPASKGRKLDTYMDKEREAQIKALQDPIMNPSLVTDHPTGRQDRILQQLSSLKQTLMQRQKELETNMSTEE